LKKSKAGTKNLSSARIAANHKHQKSCKPMKYLQIKTSPGEGKQKLTQELNKNEHK
jgi:hypothetical protein